MPDDWQRLLFRALVLSMDDNPRQAGLDWLAFAWGVHDGLGAVSSTEFYPWMNGSWANGRQLGAWARELGLSEAPQPSSIP